MVRAIRLGYKSSELELFKVIKDAWVNKNNGNL